jgi:hypothetical protein
MELVVQLLVWAWLAYVAVMAGMIVVGIVRAMFSSGGSSGSHRSGSWNSDDGEVHWTDRGRP